MRPNLRSFTDELVKLSAFPQQEQSPDAFDGAVGSTMDSTSGAGAKTGVKAALPTATASAPKKLAPTPLTTPNTMVDVASKS